MDTWRARGRGRRAAVFIVALLLHAGLVALMSNARVKRDRVDDVTTVEAMILQSPLVRGSPAAELPSPPVQAARLSSLARPHPHVPRGPERQSIAEPAIVPEPPVGAASVPLNLALSRNQIRALIAQGTPTLAQLAPHVAKASPFDVLAGDDNVDGMTLIELPHGVTEVHLRGECYRLIPTPRAQSDPFNHANERLTGPCIGSF